MTPFGMAAQPAGLVWSDVFACIVTWFIANDTLLKKEKLAEFEKQVSSFILTWNTYHKPLFQLF